MVRLSQSQGENLTIGVTVLLAWKDQEKNTYVCLLDTLTHILCRECLQIYCEIDGMKCLLCRRERSGWVRVLDLDYSCDSSSRSHVWSGRNQKDSISATVHSLKTQIVKCRGVLTRQCRAEIEFVYVTVGSLVFRR